MTDWRTSVWSSLFDDDEYRDEVWDRLVSNVLINEDTGCWEWQRYRDPKGYGRVSVKRRMVRTHQIALAISRGSIWPTSLQVDHLCRNRACCNPEHLELVTPRENSRRGLGGVVGGIYWRRKTHCPKGHPYDEANTYLRPPNDYRRYRTCRRDGMAKAYRERKK